MRLGYSEFSFGYAFTENLIRSTAAAPYGAPIFPNLNQEALVGYDVRINLPGLPLFFQYKLPQLMTRRSAFEISKHRLIDLTLPFFRMPLMRNDLSQQHELLIALEKNFPGTVLYASPCLPGPDQFNLAYNDARVHERSVFFSPGDIGPLPDDKEHSVAYQDGQPLGYFCSDPRPISAINYEALAHRAQSLFENSRFQVLRSASRELRDTIRSLVSDPMRETEGLLAERIDLTRSARRERPVESPQEEEVVKNILVAREMARVDLGVDVLIAQPHE
jgi:hypothetical protein